MEGRKAGSVCMLLLGFVSAFRILRLHRHRIALEKSRANRIHLWHLYWCQIFCAEYAWIDLVAQWHHRAWFRASLENSYCNIFCYCGGVENLLSGVTRRLCILVRHSCKQGRLEVRSALDFSCLQGRSILYPSLWSKFHESALKSCWTVNKDM
jgi:hypothetical protein